MTSQPQRVGELRPNQLLHTYGVGSVADLPNLSVMVSGLDDWDLASAERVVEDRLLAAVQAQLGTQVETLRTPPYMQETGDPFGMPTPVSATSRTASGPSGPVRMVTVPLGRQPQDGGVGGGHRLQVVDHAGQPEHLVPQRAQFSRTRLGDAVEQGLVPGLQDGDRRAQLVGDARD